MCEEIYDLEMFQGMNEQAAKQYFIGLFCGSLDDDQLDTIWNGVPRDISSTMQIDWAVSTAVDYLDALNAAALVEADNQLANQLKKADSRRDAKKRQKQKIKELEEKKRFAESSEGKRLTQSQVECYHSVRDVLKGCAYHFSSGSVLNTIRKHNFDANTAVEELLSFGVVESLAAEVDSRANLDPTPSASTSIKQDACVKSIRTVPSTGSFSVSIGALVGGHTVIRGNNVTMNASSESETSPRSTTASAMSTSVNISPLLSYYLMHLRSRNPGIIVSLDEDCMVYKGTQADCCVVNAAGELAVSLDLHGQTRKPAVDLMQSSLLHYHALLSSRHMEHYTAPEGMARRISKTQKANKAVSKLQFAEIKCVTITYVVGQGLHSAGAVPVLRNTLMQDLKSFWSDFDAIIDPENQGQIIVKVRRL